MFSKVLPFFFFCKYLQLPGTYILNIREARIPEDRVLDTLECKDPILVLCLGFLGAEKKKKPKMVVLHCCVV